MKKYLIITFLCGLFITTKAQIKDTVGLNLPIIDGVIMHEGIIEVPGKLKNELFLSAKDFLLETFVSAKAVIQSEDKEEGVINCKGTHPVILKLNFLYDGNFNDNMIIQINCKDGKYRYRIYDFRLEPTGFVGNNVNTWQSATYMDLLNDLVKKPSKKLYYTKKQELYLLKDNEIAVRDLIDRLNKKMVEKSDTF